MYNYCDFRGVFMKFKFFAMGMLLLVGTLGFFSLLQSEESKAEKHDHSEYFEEAFASPQDVTKACIECHEEQATNFLKTRHWNWLGDEFEKEGHGKMRLGKKNIINNFCIAVSSNEPRCTSCHPGYGWKDDTFDFTKTENIDCLVCHDQTGTYKKTPTAAGMPDPSVDLLAVAKSVGKSSVNTCGTCHFNGGGGASVKHGDLDPSLLQKDKNVDVHMGGQNMTCSDCHTASDHKISGAGHASTAAGTNHISCQNCHEGNEIHKNKKLNAHIETLACETCHIPAIGRNNATKTWWDWSTAGQREDEKNDKGQSIYAKKKGDFKWEENVVPTYKWTNGKVDFYLAGDKAEADKVLELNKMQGDISDPNSKIAPFKVMRGKQPYDPVNKYLIVPKLFGKGGYWKTYDWVAASELGMKSVGLEFSGKVDFIETAMYWPQNHGVAPKKKALKCMDCHGSKAKRIDWEALGYTKGDPMKKGGRKKNKLLK